MEVNDNICQRWYFACWKCAKNNTQPTNSHHEYETLTV